MSDAETLADVDEYDGMSIVDIAAAIINWPDGSEDQQRAIAAIRRRAPGMGHNQPPLGEALTAELDPLLTRQAALLDVAKTSAIIDRESAAKVTDLVGLIRTLEEELNAARLKRSKPFRDAQDLINRRFGQLSGPLALARGGESGRGGLIGMLTAFDDREKAAAEAERQRLLEEQRKRQAEADAARRAAETAAAAGKPTVDQELLALRAAEQAETLARRADAIRPEPVRSHMGQVGRRREISATIDNVRQVIGWIIKQKGGDHAAKQFAQTWLGAYLRGLGVEVVAKGVEIPGCTITVEAGSANVRR